MSLPFRATAYTLPPLAKRVAGRADSGKARAGWGALPRGASSRIRRGCRWAPWPSRRVVLVACPPRPATPHPYPSPPLGFAERGEGGARSRAESLLLPLVGRTDSAEGRARRGLPGMERLADEGLKSVSRKGRA